MQAALDALQAQDAAWALATSSSSTGMTQNPGWAAGVTLAAAEVLAEGAAEGDQPAAANIQQQGRQIAGQQGQQEGSSAVEVERWSQWSVAGSSPGMSLQGRRAAVPYLLSCDGSVGQQLLAAAVGHVLVAHDTGQGAWGLGGLTRLVLRLDRVLTDDTSALRPAGSVVALFEVTPEPISWQVGCGLAAANAKAHSGNLVRRQRMQSRACLLAWPLCVTLYAHSSNEPALTHAAPLLLLLCVVLPLSRPSGVCLGGRLCPHDRLQMLLQPCGASLEGSGRLLLLLLLPTHQTQAGKQRRRMGSRLLQEQQQHRRRFPQHSLPVARPTLMCRARTPASVLCSRPAGVLCLWASSAGASRAALHARLSCSTP